MKKLFLAIVLVTTCYFSRAQVNVGADKSFSADISNYKTFTWTADIDKIPSDKIFIGPNGVLVFNNESVRERIKNAIRYELESRGYQMGDDNADMMVTFMVLEQPGELRTYNGYETLDYGLDSIRTPENVETTHVAAGTLIINLIDNKTDKVAWQGYASGILKPETVNNGNQVKEAVHSIFQQFDFKAK